MYRIQVLANQKSSIKRYITLLVFYMIIEVTKISFLSYKEIPYIIADLVVKEVPFRYHNKSGSNTFNAPPRSQWDPSMLSAPNVGSWREGRFS